MKNCPVCKAQCFDDMDTCFGCLHSFTDEAPNGKTQASEAQGSAKGKRNGISKTSEADEPITEVVQSSDDEVRVAVFADSTSFPGLRKITIEIGFPLEDATLMPAAV